MCICDTNKVDDSIDFFKCSLSGKGKPCMRLELPVQLLYEWGATEIERDYP